MPLSCTYTPHAEQVRSRLALLQISTWASPEFKPGQQGPLPNIDDLVYIDHMHPADDTGMRWVGWGGAAAQAAGGGGGQ